MSKPRISIECLVDTTDNANTIVSNIQSRLQGKDIFNLENIEVTSDESRNIVVSVDIRFNSRLDRNDLKDYITDQIENNLQLKTWVRSAKIMSHLCSHDDDEVKDCSTTEYEVWSK